MFSKQQFQSSSQITNVNATAGHDYSPSVNIIIIQWLFDGFDSFVPSNNNLPTKWQLKCIELLKSLHLSFVSIKMFGSNGFIDNVINYTIPMINIVIIQLFLNMPFIFITNVEHETCNLPSTMCASNILNSEYWTSYSLPSDQWSIVEIKFIYNIKQLLRTDAHLCRMPNVQCLPAIIDVINFQIK